MFTAVVICVVVIVYFLVATTIIRVSTRMVAGFFPTFSSASGALFVTILFSVFVWFLTVVCGLRSETYRIPIVLGSLAIQCKVYAAMLKDMRGEDLTFLQAFFIILCQIPVALGVGALLLFLVAGGTLTLAALMPDGLQPSKVATPAPRQAVSAARWGTLVAPVNIPTPYGNVSYRAGTSVQIVRETSTGYVIRLHGAEFSTTREQVVISR
jgi:hypothetical protein